MAGTADKIQIGPFSGGLNTYSDPTAIADAECVMAENFDTDLDGSLVARPPIYDAGVFMPLDVTGDITLLGNFYGPDGTAYLIGSDGASSTYYFAGNAWILITNTFAASAMTQYNGLAFLMAPVSSINPGGSWSPATSFVSIPAMPQGSVLIAFKSRLWASGGEDATVHGTRMMLSDIADPTSWPGTFIEIGQGDGQNIIEMVIIYDSLVILKARSIYRFAFTADPAAGTPSKLSDDVGLTTKFAVAIVEGIMYFVYDNRVYQMANYQISQLNIKTKLIAGDQTGIYQPISVSSFNRRIIVTYYDVMYVYSLRTQLWTTWKSPNNGNIGRIIAVPGNSTIDNAVCHSNDHVPDPVDGETGPGFRHASIFFIADTIGTNTENFECTLQTKIYDYQNPGDFKHMFWWGVNALFRGTIQAQAVVVKETTEPTWGQLLQTTWNNLLNYTWGSLFTVNVAVHAKTVDTTGSLSIRKFTKTGGAFRFRQVYFRVIFDTNGGTSSAPVRLFSLLTAVKTTETVVAEVS